jgi:NAD-dependent DNA ligase
MSKNVKSLLEEFLKDHQKFIDTKPLNILIEFAEYANERYRNAESVITDKLYDEIEDEIKKRDPNNPFLKKIGFEATKNKIKLPYFMGSMNKLKITEQDKLDKFKKKYNKADYVIMDKLDGISGLYINDGKGNLNLFTRGDGEVGQDISYLINTSKFSVINPLFFK